MQEEVGCPTGEYSYGRDVSKGCLLSDADGHYNGASQSNEEVDGILPVAGWIAAQDTVKSDQDDEGVAHHLNGIPCKLGVLPS